MSTHATTIDHHPGARTLIFSLRQLRRPLYKCSTYEMEDTIGRVESADFAVPLPQAKSPSRLRSSLLWYLEAAGIHVYTDAAAVPVQVDREYDLFFAQISAPSELKYLSLVRGWRQRCRVAICLVEEIWAKQLTYLKMLDLLKQFDYVFVNCAQTSKPLQDIIGRPCEFVAPGIDAIGFCPYPSPPARSIDVYWMGRRSDRTHRILYEAAKRNRIHYLYDSADMTAAEDPEQHRHLLINLIKRSRYFMANKAKINAPEQTGGQEEVGFRFFEGAAGGAVMLGHPPHCDTFYENFDWPDAVINVPFDSDRIMSIIEDLDNQPERLAMIRRNNIVHSLLRFDWAYRWEQMLRTVGMSPQSALDERKVRLRQMADFVKAQPLDSIVSAERSSSMA